MLEHKIHGPTQRHFFKPQRPCAQKVSGFRKLISDLIHGAEFSGEAIKGAGLAFQAGALISSSSTVAVQLVCSSKSSWEQMFSVFIKFLLADSSRMLVVSI